MNLHLENMLKKILVLKIRSSKLVMRNLVIGYQAYLSQSDNIQGVAGIRFKMLYRYSGIGFYVWCKRITREKHMVIIIIHLILKIAI